MACGNFHKPPVNPTATRAPARTNEVGPSPDSTAPPTSIQIQGYSQHAKAEVREGQDLALTCVVPNARPAAQIVWYRANVEYKTAVALGGCSNCRLERVSDASSPPQTEPHH
uniref:Ig-like domain-containing protein n=1 Tax=Anopheles dirus TaxID=7168 RepID=A0A182ND96_9DIPT